MYANSFKQRRIRAGRKLSAAVAAAGLLASLALGARAAAQDCPNVRTFGVQAQEARPAGETRQVEVQAVYFRTEDKDAFLPEVEGRRWNPAFLTISTDAFRDKLARLLARGEAAVDSRRTGAVLLGDTAAFDRRPHPLNQNASFFDLAPAVPDARQVRVLDRYTTYSVTRRLGEPFYRLQLLSWFVEVRPDGSGRMTVDIDAGAFLRPGETEVIKFLSDFEVRRTGSARTYVAITLIPLGYGGEWSGTQRDGGPAGGR